MENHPEILLYHFNTLFYNYLFINKFVVCRRAHVLYVFVCA